MKDSTAITDAEIVVLNAARDVLCTIGERHRESVDNSHVAGRLQAAAETVDWSIFELLNLINAYMSRQMTHQQLYNRPDPDEQGSSLRDDYPSGSRDGEPADVGAAR